MNIFWLSRNPTKNASAYCDQHVVKIALEAAQMLVTALCQLYLDGSWRESIVTDYRPTHGKHPLVLWIRASSFHFEKVAIVGLSLCQEYSYRWPGKALKVEPLLRDLYDKGVALVPCMPAVQPPLCFGTVFKASTSRVRKAYREYYQYKVGAFKRPMRYTKRTPPKWLRL